MEKARIAGDSDHYTFALVRVTDEGLQPTDNTFALVSVTSILDKVLGKPAGAMSHWGYNLGIEGTKALAEVADFRALTLDDVKERLKTAGFAPNKVKSAAGERGTNAHRALELLCQGYSADLEGATKDPKTHEWKVTFHARELVDGEWVFTGEWTEIVDDGYMRGVLGWWSVEMAGWHVVASEVPVWSFRVGFCGTLDLARARDDDGYLEIVDLKTHKVARSQAFPGYDSDFFQLRLYRIGWEEVPHTAGTPDGNRVLVVDDKGRYFTDEREVPARAAEALVPVYHSLVALEEDWRDGSD